MPGRRGQDLSRGFGYGAQAVPNWMRGYTVLNIVVIGMGYVGIPCAALLADVPGFQVSGVQRRSERSGWKIDCLNNGRSPFEGDEPGLAELIRRVAVDKKTFHVSDDFSVCKEADAILIDVQTPVAGCWTPQYESLRAASGQVGRHIQPGTLVIVESTVAPGTIQHVVQPILEQESGLVGGDGFYLAFSYERVMPGKLLEFITNFPRVVGGIDPESSRRAVALYRHIVKAPISPTDTLTAEMAKVVENAYRDVNIAFANEAAMACERMGVDVFEVRGLINARPDRNMHLPGAGVGGHCLPKDSWLLNYGLETHGRPARREGLKQAGKLRLIPMARDINDAMPQHMVSLIDDALAECGRVLAGSRIALLGAAYLENADDTRNTPAAALARLLSLEEAAVVVHDPHVREADWQRALGPALAVPLFGNVWEALDGADCAALVTRHREYESLDLEQVAGSMRTPALVDGRNVFDPDECTQVGFVLRAVGKG
ncbi:nucleotide sugar dehydrogenase [Chloroflexota bacterium]